jgi:hypothetical protein
MSNRLFIDDRDRLTAAAELTNALIWGLFDDDPANQTLQFNAVVRITSLTASRLVATDADKDLTSVANLATWISGTANEIDITDDGDGTITIGIVDPLIVGKGGTGAATLTDGGILLGSGTGAITALGVATNGQIPIGDGATDPVLATITGTANQVTVTNGAGTITLSLPQDIHTAATPQFAQVKIDDVSTYIDKDGSNNMTFTDAVTGSKTLAELAAAGGESTSVSDTTTINLTLTGVNITADGLYTAGDHLTLTGADFDVDDDFLLNTGDIGTGVYDFGGATTFEIPNTAGDVTLAVAGQIAIDTTQKQLVVHDGVEKAIPLIHSLQFHGDLAGAWDVDHEWQLLDMDRGATTFPDGIVITSWYVDCSVVDPTTELNANLYYCDALANGAFPGANPVLVDVLDTTTGNASCTDMSTSDLGSGVIPTAKILYLLLDADPVDANTVWSLTINYYIPES